jgi:hypothetical protein
MPDVYGFPPATVSKYMTDTFDYMLTARDANLGYPADDNLLVQRWAWNSLNDEPYNFATGRGFNGALFDYRYPQFAGTLTEEGLTFKAYTDALLTGPACVGGNVRLESRPAAPNPSYVTTLAVTFYPADCSQPDIRSVRTDATGAFVLCNLPAGSYDIVAKGYNTLANRVTGVQLTPGTTQVDLGLLRSGDANNDNHVTILDFSILAATYATSSGDPAFDHRADFNGDGYIDILDFSLLATHFAESGAQ